MKIISKFNLALLVLSFMVIIPITAYAADGQIKIAQTPSTTFPIVIDKPGSYVLTSNIYVLPEFNGSAIDIRVPDVILDLNGHLISGPSFGIFIAGSKGINAYAGNQGRTIIKNGTVLGFGESGIEAYFSNLENITVSYCNRGISAYHSIITNCLATQNYGIGIYVENSIINNSNIFGNKRGIHGLRSNIINSNADTNWETGIYVTQSSSVTNCNVTGNQVAGIIAENTSRIEGNNLRENLGTGLVLDGTHNYAVRNTASKNGGNFQDNYPANNYMPTSLTGPDAANANVGW
jgi:hypothetical protein